MNAGRLSGDWLRHQGYDGADSLVPAQGVAQIAEPLDMKAASFVEISPAEGFWQGNGCGPYLRRNLDPPLAAPIFVKVSVLMALNCGMI